MATGLGWKWPAAFDVRQLAWSTGRWPRILFLLAHREELLAQSARDAPSAASSRFGGRGAAGTGRLVPRRFDAATPEPNPPRPAQGQRGPVRSQAANPARRERRANAS